MIIDNFEQLEGILEFPNSDLFYVVEIIQRKKDGNSTTSRKNRIFKYYIIKSLVDLNKYKGEIVSMCDTYNARAYITATARSFKRVSKEYAKLVLDNLTKENYNSMGKEFLSCCGKYPCSVGKQFIVDIDCKPSPEQKEKIFELITNSSNKGLNYCHLVQTPNGYHVLCEPFNVTKFKHDCIINHLDFVEIHKDGLTILYANV